MTITELSHALKLPVPWLKTVFSIESGNKPTARNPYTNAVGLIQFMPFVLKPWGFTPDSFPTDYNTQLNYVYKYLKPYANKIKSITDLYLAVFYPYAIGKPDNYIIGSEKGATYAGTVAKQNPGFNSYPITKKAVSKIVFQHARKVGYSKNKYYFDKAIKILNV